MKRLIMRIIHNEQMADAIIWKESIVQRKVRKNNQRTVCKRHQSMTLTIPMLIIEFMRSLMNNISNTNSTHRHNGLWQSKTVVYFRRSKIL